MTADTPHLILPHAGFAASYAEALRNGMELHHVSEDEIRRIETDFNGWLDGVFDLSSPFILNDGTATRRVPHSLYWLVRGDTFIGRINIRHDISTPPLQTIGGHVGYAIRADERKKGYGRMILELARPFIRGIGIRRAMLTCLDGNDGSRRIIEDAGGVLRDKIMAADGTTLHRRYWLDV